MNYSDKIKYIFDFGETIMTKSERFDQITSTQVTDKLRAVLPEGCKVSKKSIFAWKHGVRNPSYANRQAINQLVQEIMAKRLFES